MTPGMADDAPERARRTGLGQRKLFGTDGIRGEANVHPMTAEVALRLGRALGYRLRGSARHRSKVLIGKDTRLSGYLIETALASATRSRFFAATREACS